MTMFRVALLAVFGAAVLVSPAASATKTAAQARDDSSSYSDYQPLEEQPQHSYALQPQQTYMVYPAAPPPSYYQEEEKEEEAEMPAAAQTKEDKKCAVKLVLPPLILITIFIGLILLHLVSPTLMPAFADPFVLPFVAVVNAITGAGGPGGIGVGNLLQGLLGNLGFGPGGLFGGLGNLGIGPGGLIVQIPEIRKEDTKGRQDDRTQGPFESLLHLTAAVTAAVDDEQCLARLLCQAGTTLPKENAWSKSMKYLLPKSYHPYVTVLEKARYGDFKTCAKNYPCEQFD